MPRLLIEHETVFPVFTFLRASWGTKDLNVKKMLLFYEGWMYLHSLFSEGRGRSWRWNTLMILLFLLFSLYWGECVDGMQSVWKLLPKTFQGSKYCQQTFLPGQASVSLFLEFSAAEIVVEIATVVIILNQWMISIKNVDVGNNILLNPIKHW